MLGSTSEEVPYLIIVASSSAGAVADSPEVVSAKQGAYWQQWKYRVNGRSFWVNVLNSGHWNFCNQVDINIEYLWVVAARAVGVVKCSAAPALTISLS